MIGDEDGDLPSNWQAAELAAAAWMREHGYPDAIVTIGGSDGGIDVTSSQAVAQVKAFSGKRVGRPDLQRLFGIAASESKASLFFSQSGYTPEALAWGRQVGMALFTLAAGEVVAQTDRALEMAGATSDTRPAVLDTRVIKVLDMLGRVDRMMNRDYAQALDGRFEAREAVRAAGGLGGGSGLVVITSRRILFVRRGRFPELVPIFREFLPEHIAQPKALSDGFKFRYSGEKVKFRFMTSRRGREMTAAANRILR